MRTASYCGSTSRSSTDSVKLGVVALALINAGLKRKADRLARLLTIPNDKVPQGGDPCRALKCCNRVIFAGLMVMAVNGRKLPTFKTENDAVTAGEGTLWDEAGKMLHVYIRSSSVRQRLSVNASSPHRKKLVHIEWTAARLGRQVRARGIL